MGKVDSDAGGSKSGGLVALAVVFAGAVVAGALLGTAVGSLAGGLRGSSADSGLSAGLSAGLAAGDGEAGRADVSADDSDDSGGSGVSGAPDAGDENPYAGFRVTAFDLVDSAGQPVDQSVFDGEVTVLTFFFTSCNGPCPAIARVMREIQDRTAGSDAGRGVRLVSISVDGGRDTPAVIGSFAESYGADPSRWRFLTGEPGMVRELVRESIGFELREQADVQVKDPTGAMMNNILHPTRLLLVGPDRRLIGVYAFNDSEAVDALVADAMAALD